MRFFTLFILLIPCVLFGQNIGIGTASPHSTAKLDIQSTTGGVLIPRLSNAERDAIPAPIATGLLIFNSSNNRFEFWNGSGWGPISSTSTGGTEISDADGDTKIETEQATDEDTIRFQVGGQSIVKIDDNTFHLESLSHGTFLGLNAGKAIPSTESWNTFLGHRSGEKTNSGISNTFLGAYSGSDGNKGNSNSFVGVFSGEENIGDNNTFLGVQAGQQSGNSNNNTYLGINSGGQNTGSDNIAIGNFSMHFGSGSNNIAIGKHSLITAGNSSSNLIAIGDSTLYKNGQNTSFPFQGINNTAVGSKALKNNQLGTSNTGIGYHSLENNFGGTNNTAVGSTSLTKNYNGVYNTAIGAVSAYNNSNGSSNTSVGYSSGRYNESGSDNTYIGSLSGESNTSNGNTFVGSDSGLLSVSGSSNTFVGFEAGISNMEGSRNVSIGKRAGGSGNSNTHIGYDSGKTSDSKNSVGIGDSSLIRDEGFGNVAIGAKAGIGNLYGERNIYLGDSSGFSHANGDENIFIGYKSGGFVSGSVGAIAIGTRAGQVASNESISIGYEANMLGASRNISIGKLSGYNGVGQTSIYLGNYMGYDNAEDHRLFIGNLAYGTLIYGEMENRMVKIKNNLYSESMHINAQNQHNNANLYMKTNTGTEGRILVKEAVTEDIYFGDIDNNGGEIITRTAGQERMRITDDGNVGIGTDNPGDQVEIFSELGESALRVRVGTTTRLRVHSNGGVSIGGNLAPPAAGLRIDNLDNGIDGNLKADGNGNIYKETSSEFIALSPRNFDANPSAPLNIISQNFISVFGQTTMFAAINIPHGAQLKSLTIWCKDGQSTGNLNFNLVRNSHSSTLVNTTIGTVSSSGSGNILKAYNASASEVIDNTNHSYWLEVYSSCPPGSSINFTTVIVEYVN